MTKQIDFDNITKEELLAINDSRLEIDKNAHAYQAAPEKLLLLSLAAKEKLRGAKGLNLYNSYFINIGELEKVLNIIKESKNNFLEVNIVVRDNKDYISDGDLGDVGFHDLFIRIIKQNNNYGVILFDSMGANKSEILVDTLKKCCDNLYNPYFYLNNTKIQRDTYNCSFFALDALFKATNIQFLEDKYMQTREKEIFADPLLRFLDDNGVEAAKDIALNEEEQVEVDICEFPLPMLLNNQSLENKNCGIRELANSPQYSSQRLAFEKAKNIKLLDQINRNIGYHNNKEVNDKINNKRKSILNKNKDYLEKTDIEEIKIKMKNYSSEGFVGRYTSILNKRVQEQDSITPSVKRNFVNMTQPSDENSREM